MDRITTTLQFPLDTFKRCQLCGYESSDICEFRMWNECDDNDKPEANNILVLCRFDCAEYMDQHPRLYLEVPWSNGGPGKFMLLCGNCQFRQGVMCTHSDLKANGGEGLEVKYDGRLPNVTICFNTEANPEADTVIPCKRGPISRAAIECAGLDKNDQRHIFF